MSPDQIRRIYLIGICGTAMASLAGLLKEKGYETRGSDANVYPPMSDQLQELGVTLYSGYRAENLKQAAPDLVIPGNAIPRGNPELEQLLNSGIPYYSMAEAVKEFFIRGTKSIVIAGTHGKTTTSSLCAWLLHSASLPCSFLVGGIPLNFGRSYSYKRNSKYFVIEGDEYDTGFMDKRPKFVHYLPQIVVLNAIEYDHADLYPDFAAVENAFWQLIKIIPSDGTIIVNRDSDAAYRLARRGYSHVVTFGFHPESDYPITLEDWSSGITSFAVKGEIFQINMFGRHNLANAAAAVTLGYHLGLTTVQIREALTAFEGVKRRMELRGEVNGIIVYDDFAHHPTAIETTLQGARLAFPQSRIWGIFEPRSWSSRRNIFQHEFASALSGADIAILGAVFEPEKLPEEIRLNPQLLIEEIRSAETLAHYLPDQEQLIDFVVSNAKPGDRLIIMSNGSFDHLHEKLLAALKQGS